MESNLKYQRLNSLWREIINKIPVIDNMEEFLIIKYLVQNGENLPIISQFPFVYGYHFPLDPKYPVGKIELLLTDGNKNFLAIKVNFIEIQYQ